MYRSDIKVSNMDTNVYRNDEEMEMIKDEIEQNKTEELENRKKEIDESAKFSLEVKDVFKLNRADILIGKGTLPLYEGKVHCGEIELEISPAWGNSQENLDNLSFQVKRGKAERSLIGKIFTN